MEQGAATQPPSQVPRDWAIDPFVAWTYLALNVIFFVAQLWPVTLAMSVIAAVFTFRERRKYGFPAFWWTVAVLIFGPLAFLGFVYKRSRAPVAYPPSAPPTGPELD